MVIAKREDFLKLSNEILNKGNNLRFQAKGLSMHPFIKNGEVIEIKPISSSEIEIGDIVFYRSSWGGMVAHRVIRKQQKAEKVILLTKGDSVPVSDEEIYPEQVLGKVIAIERNGSKIILNKGLLNKFKSLVWVKISPHSWWIYPIFGKFKQIVFCLIRLFMQFIQKFRFYRILARKILLKNVSLREATTDDNFLLSQFYGYIKPEELGEFSEIIQKNKNEFKNPTTQFIALKGEEIIGSVVVVDFLKETVDSRKDTYYEGWWIFGLLVRFRYRRLGIGERLIKVALDRAVQEDASEVKLLVFEKAKPAIKLYQKLGFKQVFMSALEEEFDKKGFGRPIIMARKVAKK